MALRTEPLPKPVLAVIDGNGPTAEVHLYSDCKGEQECPWPAAWGRSWVSQEFLEAQGLRVITA